VASCWRGFRGIATKSGILGGSGTTHAYAGPRFVAARADRGDGRAMAEHGDKNVALAALSQPRSLVWRKSVLLSRRTTRSRRMGGGGQDRRGQRRPQGLVLRAAARPPMLAASGMQTEAACREI
jgi:hypothetical protein